MLDRPWGPGPFAALALYWWIDSLGCHKITIMVTTVEQATQLRRSLGRLGVWMPPIPALGLDPAEHGATIEYAGFRSVWFPGVNSPQDLKPLA